MSAGTTIASILLLCAVLAVGVWLWLKQRQTVQREAFQALAARRGWSLTISEQKLGRPAILRLTARSGRGWHCESRLHGGPDHGMPDYLTTEFVAEEPQWPEGSLVLTAATADSTVSDPALSDPDAPNTLRPGKSKLTMADRVSLALKVEEASQLRPYPAPLGLDARATCDPAHQFDLDALAEVLAVWPAQYDDTDGQPIIQIGPLGFRVQVNHGMDRADQMESFIDLALNLIRVI